jgi:hypothetical protein
LEINIGVSTVCAASNIAGVRLDLWLYRLDKRTDQSHLLVLGSDGENIDLMNVRSGCVYNS